MPHPMLKYRLISGLSLAAVIILAVIFAPEWMGTLILCGLTAWGTLEFYALLDGAGIPNFRYIGTAGSVATVLFTYLGACFRPDIPLALIGMAVGYFVIVVVFIRQFPQKNNPVPLQTIAGTLLGVFYVGFLFNFLNMMLLEWGPREGRLLLVYTIATVKMTDAGAYFIGCAIGRHKLIPRISPAKSWEGVLGGILTGTVAGIAFMHFAQPHFGTLIIPLPVVAGMAFLLAVLGVLGDLIESLFKRAAGVKDSGVLFTGIGGILDVLDSILFAAPAAYVLVRLWLH